MITFYTYPETTPTMCGRFYIKGISRDAEEYFQNLFGIDIPPPDQAIFADGKEFLPWNDIPVLYTSSTTRTSKLTSMFWNLIPYYEKEFKPPRTWFNTRKERLEDPYQKNLLVRKRCIVPVSGFLENKKVKGKPVYHTQRIGGKSVRKKETYDFTHKHQPLMALGGIYDTWNKDKQDPRYSCSIITMDPNPLIADIHDRMPFILPNDFAKIWLDKEMTDVDLLLHCIVPYPAEQLKKTDLATSTRKNSG